LIARANAICDAHLRLMSTEEVPKIFRQGLHYVPEKAPENVDDNMAQKPSQSDLEVNYFIIHYN